MHRSSLHHPILCGLLTAWIIPMVPTPVWPLDHRASPTNDAALPHKYEVGDDWCDSGDPMLDQVDCVLTMATTGAIAPHHSGIAASSGFRETATGLSPHLSARAPPTC